MTVNHEKQVRRGFLTRRGRENVIPNLRLGSQREAAFCAELQKHQELEELGTPFWCGCGGFQLKVKQLYQITKHRNTRHS